MIFRRLVLVLAAAAVLATSAAVAVVALAFALYGLVSTWVSPAAAAAIVAGAAAVVLAIAAMILLRKPRARREGLRATRSGGVVERALSLVKERPVVAIAAAIGAGVLVIRNPRYLGAAIRAFVEGRETPPAL